MTGALVRSWNDSSPSLALFDDSDSVPKEASGDVSPLSGGEDRGLTHAPGSPRNSASGTDSQPLLLDGEPFRRVRLYATTPTTPTRARTNEEGSGTA